MIPDPVGVVGYDQILVSLLGWDGVWNEEDSGVEWRHPAGICKLGGCFLDKTLRNTQNSIRISLGKGGKVFSQAGVHGNVVFPSLFMEPGTAAPRAFTSLDFSWKPIPSWIWELICLFSRAPGIWEDGYTEEPDSGGAPGAAG